MCLAGSILSLLCVTSPCVYTQVQITCTGQHPVADTLPQPAETPAGTLTDTLLSPQQSSESTNIHTQHTNTVEC